MDNFIESLIGRSESDGRFSDRQFALEYNELSFPERRRARFSPELLYLCFSIKYDANVNTDYYYWDKTTLSMKSPLLEYVNGGAEVLEIGPGPLATLSLFLYKNIDRLNVTCAELNPEFVVTAKQMCEANGVCLKIIQSDIVQNIHGRYDVAFMNPPYVQTEALRNLGVSHRSNEGKSGDGGNDGSSMIQRFLREVPSILSDNGIAILGVNNYFVEDVVICSHIQKSPLRLARKFYANRDVYPEGPYSQVYILNRER